MNTMNTAINTNICTKTRPDPTKKVRTADSADVWVTIQLILVFLPLITTLAWALYAMPNMPIPVVDFVLVPMMFIGWIATLLSCPLRLLKLLGKFAGKPFLAGLMIPIIPFNFVLAVAFGGAGLVALTAILAFAPAIVTIANFFLCD